MPVMSLISGAMYGVTGVSTRIWPCVPHAARTPRTKARFIRHTLSQAGARFAGHDLLDDRGVDGRGVRDRAHVAELGKILNVACRNVTASASSTRRSSAVVLPPPSNNVGCSIAA